MAKLILGLGLSNDASGVLLSDGIPVVGVQLERLTRKKHDGRRELVGRLIAYCLDEVGVELGDLDGVGVCMPDVHTPSDLVLPGFDASQKSVLHVGHHLSHAYSAFAPSRFESSAVLVIDGHGDSYYESVNDRLIAGSELLATLYSRNKLGDDTEIAPRSESESIYRFDRTGLPSLLMRNYLGFGRRSNRHRGQFVSLGIGAGYKFISSVLFGPGDHSGKVMGLAPYGSPRDDLPKSYRFQAGEVRLDDLWRHQVRREIAENPELRHDHEWAADLAAYVQRETEELVSLLAARATAGEVNLCLAGGVALNATTNGVLERELGLDVFVQPAASDAGLALGAAYASHHLKYGFIPHGAQRLTDDLGVHYSKTRLEADLAGFPSVHRAPSLDSPRALAAEIARGAVIGWFEGGSEFGPRALGHRSIIADARSASMRDRINLEIKAREWFRPFGPVVMEEHASEWFVDGGQSSTMTTTTFVREALRGAIPAVTHVDGSSRVQLLGAEISGYRRLLEEFYVLTGVPVLINTSFNGKDSPIVETPGDAFDAFISLGLDVLWLDGTAFVCP